MRVLIADAHENVRWALRTAIRECPGAALVGEASEATGLICQARASRPDLVILEWELPGSPMDQVLVALRALDHGVRIVALGRSPGARIAALAAGADAFASKADAPQAFLAALDYVDKD
jgi:DNA-binding NarL/FixJ family response regulator